MGFVADMFGGGAARHAANVANVRAQAIAAQQKQLAQEAYNQVLNQGTTQSGNITGAAKSAFGTGQAVGAQGAATQAGLTTNGQNINNELLGVAGNLYGNTTGVMNWANNWLSPQINAGNQAAAAYQRDLPYLSTPYQPTQAQLNKTPGYQFIKNQGLQAAQNAAAARGLGVSGNALEAAANYATGLANNTYSNLAGIYQRGQQVVGNNLIGGMNAGTQAASTLGNIDNSLLSTANGTYTNLANAGANAQANLLTSGAGYGMQGATQGLMQGANYNLQGITNASDLMQGAQNTATADLLNQNNQGFATSLTGDQMAASGQLAYNTSITSGINSIANLIGSVAGAYGAATGKGKKG